MQAACLAVRTNFVKLNLGNIYYEKAINCNRAFELSDCTISRASGMEMHAPQLYQRA